MFLGQKSAGLFINLKAPFEDCMHSSTKEVNMHYGLHRRVSGLSIAAEFIITFMSMLVSLVCQTEYFIHVVV